MLLTDLKGVSTARVKILNKLNIFSVEDLLNFYPKNYRDFTSISSIFDAYHNDFILTVCNVVSKPEKVDKGEGKGFVRVMCEQDGQHFTIIWFNQLYVAEKLSQGEYLFYGRVRTDYGIQLVNPTFERIDRVKKLNGFAPVYSTKGLIEQQVLRNIITDAIQKYDFCSLIPSPLQQKYELLSLKKAYEFIHNPNSFKEKEFGAIRIAIEEYFSLITAFKFIKNGLLTERKNLYKIKKEEITEFIKRFSFEFTQGQLTAVDEIYKNLKSNYTMNRLLQGDVGIGKTAVSFCGIFMAVKSGYQSVMLSPTEVLAKQTYEKLKEVFFDYNVAYLSGGTPLKEKREIKEKLLSGEIDIICGTHAIIQKDVQFTKLALCVCDEQQRFGVSQRSKLLNKGNGCDMLVMSATPIPRTLSLVVYGDLDITTITQSPEGRQSVGTHIVKKYKYEKMFTYLEQEFKKGKQAYFVCPKIEEDESDVTALKELFEDVQKRMPSVHFSILHGKMKDKDKIDIMQKFKDKQIDCLISTTVIEVGVDVPSATIMVIFDAERFGLSQLHQLRGRVGRGNEKSFCFLVVGKESEEGLERLNILKNHLNGFEIAECDLKMRGGGDFIGTRQSGRFIKGISGLKYPANVITKAKQISEEMFNGRVNLIELDELLKKKYDYLFDVSLN